MDNSTAVESVFLDGGRKRAVRTLENRFSMNIASNGIRLHVADQGKGALAIVFLHGWGASTRTWEHVIAALPLGYRTVAIDQRGWGSSDHPASGYSLAELADDTEGAIEALGLERYILVGHSMGGKTVQFLASRRPKGLAGLVLLASAPPSPFTVPEQLRVMMSGPNVREFVTMAVEKMLTSKPISREDVELLVADAIRGSVRCQSRMGSPDQPRGHYRGGWSHQRPNACDFGRARQDRPRREP